MRARLELTYNLNNQEEASAVRDVLDVGKFKSILWELDNYLRGIVKHGISEQEVMRELNKSYITGVEIEYTEQEKEKIMTGYIEACDQIRSKIYELLNEENVSLDG